MRLRPVVYLLFILGASLVACTDEDATQHKAAPRQGIATDAAFTRLLPYFNQQWAMQKLWEDGLAEVATYEAEREIYGKKRRFEYTLITVKEEFNEAFNVKTDDYQRPDLFPVMKVNQFCRIPTDQYPYHLLTSLFFRRDQPVALHKLTTSSQEWCGNTFKALTDEGSRYEQTYNSYWDGQGAGHRALRHDVLFEDALPYTLRSLNFEALPTFEATICDLQQTSKVTPPVYYQARLTVADARPADTGQAAWLVTVRLDAAKESTYWFAKEYPNALLRQASWDGRTLKLKNLRRYAYWTH